MDAASSRGRRGEGCLTGPARWTLAPLWPATRLAVGLRAAAYDRRHLPVYRVDAPVIGVGNLAAGGTGKTPLVAWLVAELRRRGRRPAVASRGYGGGADGGNDEAALVGAPVHSDGDRVAAARAAIAAGADVVILDDGFQHRRLARNCDLVCIDATRPWSLPAAATGEVFPLGLLREPPRALARADCVVLTRCDQVSTRELARLLRRLRGRARHLVRCRHTPVAVRRLDDALASSPVVALHDRRVWAVSGIGNPAAFERALAGTGAEVVGATRFADHHRFTPAEVEAARGAADDAGAVVCTTTKDAVRLEGLWPADHEGLILEVALAFAPGDAARLGALVGERLEGTSGNRM